MTDGSSLLSSLGIPASAIADGDLAVHSPIDGRQSASVKSDSAAAIDAKCAPTRPFISGGSCRHRGAALFGGAWLVRVLFSPPKIESPLRVGKTRTFDAFSGHQKNDSTESFLMKPGELFRIYAFMSLSGSNLELLRSVSVMSSLCISTNNTRLTTPRWTRLTELPSQRRVAALAHHRPILISSKDVRIIMTVHAPPSRASR
jgi:hypothetical protein